MYGIKARLITINDILSQITQEEIWEYYLGFPVKTGKLFISPLREEYNPSANLFYSNDNNLLLKDFGYGVMNVWQFIQHKYNLTFSESLQKVAIDLKLKSGIKLDIKPNYNHTVKKRDRTTIQIKILDWNDKLLKYWLDYGISINTLKFYKVIPVVNLWINNEPINFNEPAFSYEFGNGLRKIYIPNSNTLRFISNVPGNIYSGFDQLDWLGEILILTKSHKDVMVWRELGYNAISPQGEGHKIDESFMYSLNKRFNKIIVNYDNDEAGIRYTEKIINKFNLPTLFIPEFKDISDYSKNYGINKTKEQAKIWISTR